MKIQVTEEDILSGVRFSCSRCPIAKAIHRAMGNDEVSVGVVEAWFPTNYGEISKRKSIALPAEVTEFIRVFDGRKPKDPFPKPFEFEINFPQEG